MDCFITLDQSLLKFNELEAKSKELTVLVSKRGIKVQDNLLSRLISF